MTCRSVRARQICIPHGPIPSVNQAESEPKRRDENRERTTERTHKNNKPTTIEDWKQPWETDQSRRPNRAEIPENKAKPYKRTS